MEVLKAFVFNDIDHIVQTINDGDNILFKANDIAKVLDLGCIRTSIATFDESEKEVHTRHTLEGLQQMTFLTEVGVYRLLFQSRKPIARPFQKWVAQVVKTIREKGYYDLAQANAKLEEANNKHKELLINIGTQTRLTERASTHTALVNSSKSEDPLVYIGFIRDIDEESMLIKIGSTKNLKARAPQLIEEFGYMQIMHVFHVDMHIQFETLLQLHTQVKPLVYTEPIHNNHVSNREVFLMKNSDIATIVRIATWNAHKFKRDIQPELDHEVARWNNAVADMKKEGKVIVIPQLAEIIVVSSERKYTQARGNKIQRYSPDGKTLIQTYNGFADVYRDTTMASPCSAQLRNAAKNKHLYKSFRWAKLDRSHDDNTIQDIGDTIESRQVKHGFIAMINLASDCIMKVFPDMKSATTDRQHKSPAAISSAIKKMRPSGGHLFRMWHDCDEILQTAYLQNNTLPDPIVRGNSIVVQQIHPISKIVVATYSSVAHAIKIIKVSRKSIMDAIQEKRILHGHLWELKE